MAAQSLILNPAVYLDAMWNSLNATKPARLRQASTHWLRHTHGSHAVADKVPLDVVQYNLGHKSLDTTSIYVTAERSRRIREMRRFTEGKGG